MEGRSLSLVIPAYNEEAGIRQAVVEADEALARLATEYEVLVVDDGSADGTAAVVEDEARNRPHVRLLRHSQNRGYGAALRTGFEAARCDRVAFTDADCQFHLDDLSSLLRLTDAHAIAVGVRVDRQDVWRRRFFSWGYNTLTRTLLGTGVRDVDCALKVFRRDVVRDLMPQSRGYFVNTEMLTRARLAGHAVAETPVRHRPRLRGESKVSLRDIPRTLATLLPFWWSRVLFRGGAEPTSAPLPTGSILGLVALLLVTALLFFSRLGAPLQEPEESRYAEIPRQMLEAGSWAVPVLHGQPYLDKPPLLYWLVMSSYQLFGVHDWAARLVTSLSGFLTVLVITFWAWRSAGARAALAAGFVLALSGRFVYLERLLTMNSLLCLWVTLGLAAAHLAVQGGRLRRGWWLASAVAGALGVLTKGPVALVLIAVPAFSLQLLDPRPARVRVRDWAGWLGLTALLAAPWFVTVALRDPDFLGYFFWKHHVVRYVEPFDHAKPVWFYLSDVLLGMLPWALLLIPLLKRLTRPGPERLPEVTGFALLAAVWCLLFYSLGGSKRSGYVLPAMPPLALVLGCYLDQLLAAAPRPDVVRLARQAGMVALGVGAVGALAAGGARLLPVPQAFLGAVTAVVAMAGLYYYGRGWRAQTAWGVSAGVTFLVLFAGLHVVFPGYARRFAMRGQVRAQVVRAEDSRVPVFCYPRGWDSVNFYLRRSDVQVYPRDRRQQLVAELRLRPHALAFVKSDRSLEELLHALPGSLEFVPEGRRGNVTVGWVRPRGEAPAAFFAGMD